MIVPTEGRPSMRPAVDFGRELARPDVRAAPYPLYHRMRREDPVHYSRALGAWLVTRYDHVVSCFRDPRLAGDRTRFLIDGQLGTSDRGLVLDFERIERGMMINKEGAAHRRLRRLLQHGFTPARLDAARPLIQKAVDGLLDRAAGAGRLDVVADFAEPLPTLVICALMGIPAEDGSTLRRWSSAKGKFRGLSRGDRGAVARAANDATVHLERYFLSLAEERRRWPGEDLVSVLVAGHEEGRLTAAEVAAQCQLLFSAGHQTLIDALCNAVHAFLSHLEQHQALRADPSLIGGAVEETLRYDPSVAFVHKVAAGDLEVGGRAIGQGQLVLLGIAAANRDPEAFADPDRFDIRRAGQAHVSFATGAHACLGMGLARLELAVALLTLFGRFSCLRLDPRIPPLRRSETLMFPDPASALIRRAVRGGGRGCPAGRRSIWRGGRPRTGPPPAPAGWPLPPRAGPNACPCPSPGR
jgi:cytochrome P450 PksS